MKDLKYTQTLTTPQGEITYTVLQTNGIVSVIREDDRFTSSYTIADWQSPFLFGGVVDTLQSFCKGQVSLSDDPSTEEMSYYLWLSTGDMPRQSHGIYSYR